MRRPYLIVGLGLVVGLSLSLAYILYPFFQEDGYRKALETGLSAVLERPVKLKGPISFTFSLHPLVILENIHVANPSWASQDSLIRADRLEIQVSLAPLLQRRLRVEKMLLHSVNFLLEENAAGLNNWTIQKETSSSILAQAVPTISIDIPKAKALAITDSRISYRSYLSHVSHEMVIRHASLLAISERMRKFSIEGHWDDAPFLLELQGGRVMDLFDVQKAWPIDGILTTNGASIAVKGSFGGSNPDEISSLHIQINGDRLSALNEVLKTDLPDSAPFMVAADVLQSAHAINLNTIKAKLGLSEITGQLTVQNQDDRQKVAGTLVSNIIQVNDFTFPSKAQTQEVSPQQTGSPVPKLHLPFDADVDVTIHKSKLGKIELGSGSFSANIREKRIQITPVRGKSFGGILNASLDINLTDSEPRTLFSGSLTAFNFGQALQDFGVTENITGSTDLNMRVIGNGTNIQDFLKSLNLKLRTNRTTWGYLDSIPDNRPPIAFHQGSLTVSKGGPLTLTAKGTIQTKAFRAKLKAPTPIEFLTGDMTWPVSLTAQMDDAVLKAKGTLNAEPQDIPGKFVVSLQGKQLNELGDAFPPVGPYRFQAQVTKEGPRYLIHALQSRFGTSDLSGTLEIDTKKNIPQLTGNLTANHINFNELSTPGDSEISPETLGGMNGDLNLTIQQSKIGAFELAGLKVEANLQAGHLTVKEAQGAFRDQKSSYVNFQGAMEVDTTNAIPSVSGQVALTDIRYEHVFPTMQFENLNEHVMNLDAKFSGRGNTMSSLLSNATIRVEGDKVQVQFQRGADHSEPVQLSSKIVVDSVEGGPLRLHAEGKFKQTPFQLRSLAGPPSDLLKSTGLWPINVQMDVPQAMVELHGHVQLPFPATEFALQVLVKADNLQNFDELTAANLPDAGPLHLTALVRRSPVGYHVTDLKESLGETAVEGHMTVMTNRPRPRVMGVFSADKIVLGTLKPPTGDASPQGPVSVLETITAPLISIGAITVDSVTSAIGKSSPSRKSEARILPNVVFPVEILKLFDLSIETEIKDLRTEQHEIGKLKFHLTLEEGLLSLQPLTGKLWNGEIGGSVTLDVNRHVPTLEMNVSIRGLDYSRLTAMFGQTDIIKGQSESMMLNLKGRGDTLNEVLNRANGNFEWVNGPLELSTKYIDLWAADFITTAFSTAWKAIPVSILNCAVGYFDIDEGQMKTETILIDSERVTIAGVGTLNLASENMDVIFTPRPKDPSLISLAHTVRLTGPLSDPDATRDKFRIAESGGWMLLGLASPIGWALAIPNISGTTVGTMNKNPCIEALKGQDHTARALDDIKGGLWGKIKKTFSNLIGTSETPSDHPQ